MRQILFRGKTKKGEWVYGAYYKQKQYYGDEREVDCIITTDDVLSNDLGLDYEEVIPETVGQFTGLCDKNGKKIFEGDVVKIYLEKNTATTGFIIYVNCLCRFAFVENGVPYGFDETTTLEVIGNIHDNNFLGGGNNYERL